MRNLKKILALALALVMTLSVMTVANAAFTDSKDITEAYTEAVDVLSGMGVFKGTGTGSTFSPKQSITRAEVAAIIYRIVTGDVTDKQAGIYADYAKFKDVKSTAWYAGYVGYCSNANLIKGDGKGNFLPTATVTGYQALAMILRAMGYDVNGEFTGAGWEVKVASTAQQRGILVNVNAGTLGTAAAREVVAELLFQAIQKSTVVYTPALGYYTADLLGGVATTSLGYKTFGLTSDFGYVVGNQATGETATILGEYPVVKTLSNTERSWTLKLATETGLDMFGHYAKVWYNAKSVGAKTVYASYDKATSATVTYAEYNALKAADKANYFSNSYGVIDAVPATWDYNILVTNPGTADNVLIRLNLDIAQFTAINNYVKIPYLTVKSGAANGQLVSINLADASGYTGLTLGSYVNVLTVTGTNLTAGKTFFQKQLSALTGYTNVTVKYVAKDGTITLTDGTTVKSSSLTHKGYAAAVNAAMDIRNGWNFSTTYNIYTDMFGNYVGATTKSNDAYAKLVYAYYETVVATGEITYYAQVVRNDGTIETIKLAMTAAEYNALTCSKLDWGNKNAVTQGNALDVVLTPKANGFAISHKAGDGDCQYIADAVAKVGLTTVGRLTTGGAAWVVNKNTYTVGALNNYFVDASTKFVTVEGFGGKLVVKTYTLAELVGENRQVTIPSSAIVTYTQTYSASIYANNYHVDYVLVEGATATPVSNLIYIESGKAVGTSAEGNVYDVYFNGKAEQATVATANGVQIKGQTFYTYELRNGVCVLTGEANGNGCLEDRVLTKNAGTAYTYVRDNQGNQKPITEQAVIINLTDNTALNGINAIDLITAAENGTITVDVEIVNNAITVVYIVGYVAR